MTAFVDRIVQTISEAAPIERAVSNIVAGVLEHTATKLSRGESVQVEEDRPDKDAAEIFCASDDGRRLA